MRPKDVMAFVTAQRRPKPGAENVVRIADGSAGLSAATIKRRLAAVSSFYGYLITRDDVDGDRQPGPPGHRHPSEPLSRRSGPAAGARCAPAAPDPRPRRDRRAHGSAAHRAGPGHDPGHGARRPAALRGARSSSRRSASRRMAGVDQRRQGRTRTPGAAVADLLRHRGALHGPRATARDDERCRCSSRSKEHVAASRSRCRAWTRSSAPPGCGPVSATAPATSCATPASPVSARRAWPSKPSRPRPDTAPSPRPGSISTSVVDWLADEYRRAIEAIEAQALVGVAQ